MKSIDFKTLLIGLLLGVCVTLSMGQRAAEPAHKLDADYRYQISATEHLENGQAVYTVFILDHEKNKVYSNSGYGTPGRNGIDVKSVVGQ